MSDLADKMLKERAERTIATYREVCADIHKAIHLVDNTAHNSGLMQLLCEARDFITETEVVESSEQGQCVLRKLNAALAQLH